MKRLLLTLAATAALALPCAAVAAWYGTATLGPTGDPDSFGSATVSIDNSNLMTVVVDVSNINPSTTHVSHIHTGSCAAQGAVYIGLSNIVTDGAGHGMSTTVENGSSSTNRPGTVWPDPTSARARAMRWR